MCFYIGLCILVHIGNRDLRREYIQIFYYLNEYIIIIYYFWKNAVSRSLTIHFYLISIEKNLIMNEA